jgi:sugar phosphate isomerase/epimerase
MLWVLGALESVDVGICLDTGHAYLSGDLSTVVHKLSGHLWMVHASDNHGHGDDHLPPGQGSIGWEALIGQLTALRFEGTVILEIAGNDDMDAVLESAAHARRYLWEMARQRGHGDVPRV